MFISLYLAKNNYFAYNDNVDLIQLAD